MVGTLRVEDKLEGATNFQTWKARILLLLEENDLKDYIEMVILDPNDAQELAAHKKKEVKAKQVLLDSVKDHLILIFPKRRQLRRCMMLCGLVPKWEYKPEVDFEA
jgi:hypothetical protein